MQAPYLLRLRAGAFLCLNGVVAGFFLVAGSEARITKHLGYLTADG
jgi:hypothetical protein